MGGRRCQSRPPGLRFLARGQLLHEPVLVPETEDLAQLAGRTRPVHVIVTADTRGDYIERMVESCGGHALRVADGRASFGKLKEILEEFRGRDASLAVALDGPLGPRHEPKRLAFYFA